MSEPNPRRWRRWLLIAALVLPALAAALWFGNIWQLTRERDRLRAEAEAFGPVYWRELASQTLAEQRANPGAADEMLEAIARFGGEYGRKFGFAPVLDAATETWLEQPAGNAGPLPVFAAASLVRGQDALRRLHVVAGKPPGLLTAGLETETPWTILLPHMQDCRQADRLLWLEARAAVAAGDVRRAYATALTAARLPRQLDREPCLVCWLVGSATEGIAAEKILPLALALGPPTAEEFLALDRAWAAAPNEASLPRSQRHDLAMMLAVTQRPKDWAENRLVLLKSNRKVPTQFQQAMARLEGTAFGEPVRLRAEAALLELRIGLERHLAAGKDIADFHFRHDDPMFDWMVPWPWALSDTLRLRRGTAFAARLALRVAKRWHETGVLPERWQEAQGDLPTPAPGRLGAYLPSYDRRPRGFALRVVGPDRTDGPALRREIVVDFPAAKENRP